MAVNYKVIWYQIRYIVALILLVGAAFYGQKGINEFIAPTEYVVSCDMYLSENMKQSIKSYLDSYSWKNISTCIQDLHNNFALVSSIEISLSPLSIAYIDIQTKEPRFFINTELVLTYEDNALHKRSCFSSYAWEQPMLYIHNVDEKLDPEILSFINQYDYQLYEQFTCEWYDSDHVYFHDRKDVLWHLLCSSHACMSDQILDQYEKIVSSKKVVQEHIVDVRFADQIVVYQNRGELYG